MADRAAFNLGKTLAAATLPTFTGPEHLQWPRESEQEWKEFVLLPRVQQALATLSEEFLLDVRLDEQQLIRTGTPWTKLYDKLLTALDPQSVGVERYLGIELDPHTRVLRRPRYEDLALSELPWRLVRILLEAGPRLSKKERLDRAWEAGPPEQRTFDKQLSRLRGALKRIDVRIENQPGDGWRLVDDSSTAAS